jgi:transposase
LRGGLSTKISIAVDALGNPVRFILTAGQVADISQAEGLISGFSFENLLADKGYDSDRFRASIADAAAPESARPAKTSKAWRGVHSALRCPTPERWDMWAQMRLMAVHYSSASAAFCAPESGEEPDTIPQWV